MQDYWTEVSPPTHITSAALAGFKGSEAAEDGSDELIEDPDQLAAALSGIPGGSVLGT